MKNSENDLIFDTMNFKSSYYKIKLSTDGVSFGFRKCLFQILHFSWCWSGEAFYSDQKGPMNPWEESIDQSDGMQISQRFKASQWSQWINVYIYISVCIVYALGASLSSYEKWQLIRGSY